MAISAKTVGEALRLRRPDEPEVRRVVGRWYGGLASVVLGVLLLAVVGAALGPRWDPEPLGEQIEVARAETAITGAPALPHYETKTSIVTVRLTDEVSVRARIIEPIGTRGPVPGVVFVHGAGTGRFAEAFVDHAVRLAEAGIATMVPDKRMDTYSMRFRDYVGMAADYEKSVELLRARPNVDASKVGVYAESEGGWIAPVMGATDPDLAFLVLVSNPVVPPRQQAAFAADNYLRNTGVPHGVFRAIPRAVGMSIPGGGFDYVDFDVQPFLEQLQQPLFVAYGTADASMPIVQGAQQILAAADVAGNDAVIVRYYAGADHGVKVDRRVLPEFLDDVTGWILGLPRTGILPPQIAGEQPHQDYLAAPVPQPRWITSGDVLIAIVLGAAALVVLPWLAVLADRAVRRARVTRRGWSPVGVRVATEGPRWAPGIAWRLAGVGFGAIATVAALVWYIVAIGRLAMDYQQNALVVQGGWILVRALGIWVVVAAVLLGRRMTDVRASGGRVAPGAVRLVGTWAVGLGTLTLLVVLAYWGVFQLGI